MHNMSMTLWTRLFLEAQGHKTSENVIDRDDASSIKLESNGQASVGKRSRHINVRCFFVADQIKQGNVQMRCRSTNEMMADHMTKPLQGKKFQEFRKQMLNLPSKEEDDHVMVNLQGTSSKQIAR